MKFVLILWIWNSLGTVSVTTAEFADFSACMTAGEQVVTRVGTDIVGKPTTPLDAKYTCEYKASPQERK